MPKKMSIEATQHVWVDLNGHFSSQSGQFRMNLVESVFMLSHSSNVCLVNLGDFRVIRRFVLLFDRLNLFLKGHI